MSADKHFNCDKVFVYLFMLTMLEVLWGYAFGRWFPAGKLVLWGGLLFFAFYKGWLIAVYFMHLKFEGWVVKSLLLPTPFLVMVIFGYVMPDVADKEGNLIYPVGMAYDPAQGAVLDLHHHGAQESAEHDAAPEH